MSGDGRGKQSAEWLAWLSMPNHGQEGHKGRHCRAGTVMPPQSYRLQVIPECAPRLDPQEWRAEEEGPAA